MECLLQNSQHYRPLFTLLRIGKKEYAVMDRNIAEERASECLSRALYLMQADEPSRHINTINAELLTACDLGSADAAFLLASRVLDSAANLPFSVEESIVFLRLAADRHHAEAAYQLACCYASMEQFQITEQLCVNYFAAIDMSERVRLAEYYFTIAIDLNHREAIEDLIIAYAYGRGYLAQNVERFVALCEKLVAKQDQSVALGYGAWLANMTVEGEPLLPEAIRLPKNCERAMNSFIIAANGSDLTLAQHALYLMFLGASNEESSFSMEEIEEHLKTAVKAGHQLISLYFAWYSIPTHQRGLMPALLEEQPLTFFARFVEQDENLATKYLDNVLIGGNLELTNIAKELLLQVCGYGNRAYTLAT